MTLEPRLAPPETKNVLSVARVADDWYVACFSKELKKKPIARTVLGIPLVLYRTADGTAGALLDRCPHRNVPLSLGKVVGPNLQCVYHGWQFDQTGACKRIPGLYGEHETKGRKVGSYPVVEKQGCVWVYTVQDGEPDHDPFEFPLVGKPGYSTVYKMVQASGSLHAVAENALDVPHTAFLHKGLFRGVSEPNEIDVVVRRWPDRVEAEYIGEPRPTGIVGWILSPSGGPVTHFDRFLLPSIVQVEYSIGSENHIFVCAAGTPETDFRTRLYAVVSFRLRIPHWLVTPLTPLALRIFKQDAELLSRQTEQIHQFGGEQFASTEIDVLGQHIWRLLRQAERGESPDVEMVEKKLRLEA
jgi:phenylpropionate dioxygenase-like ring-hydroxylating dioxygenase large terminal subunit